MKIVPSTEDVNFSEATGNKITYKLYGSNMVDPSFIKKLKPSTTYHVSLKLKKIADPETGYTQMQSLVKGMAIYCPNKNGTGPASIYLFYNNEPLNVGDTVAIKNTVTMPADLHDESNGFNSIVGYSEIFSNEAGDARYSTLEMSELIISEVDAEYEPYTEYTYELGIASEDIYGHPNAPALIDIKNQRLVIHDGIAVLDGITNKARESSDSRYWNFPRNTCPNIRDTLLDENNSRYSHIGKGFGANNAGNFVFTTPGWMDGLFETPELLNEYLLSQTNAGNPMQIQYLLRYPKIIDFNKKENTTNSNLKYRTYVEEIEERIPDYENSTIKVSSSELSVTASTYTSILTRISEIVNILNERKEIIDRARSIEKDGSIPMEILKGAIDANTQRMMSVSSGWATDEQGNTIYTTIDGTSAMMLNGMGFMIANSKKDNGDWNWRTFGTGEGFTADLITTGFLSADRILAGSITTSHLSAGVFEELLIDAQELVTIEVGKALEDIDLDFNFSIPNLIRDSKEINIDAPTDDSDKHIIYEGTLKANTDYILSIDSIEKIRGENNDIVVHATNNGSIIYTGTIPVSDDVQSFTFKTSDNIDNIIVYIDKRDDDIFVLNKVKLAEGTKYVGWSPHYDDFYVGIENNRANISIADDRISQTVESVAYIREDIENLNEEDRLIRNDLSSQILQTEDRIDIKFTNTESYINAVDDNINQFKKEVETFITFEEDGIRIGKSDSPFASKFGNEELAFYEGNVKIAYFSNQQLDALAIISDRFRLRYDNNTYIEMSALSNGIIARVVRL